MLFFSEMKTPLQYAVLIVALALLTVAGCQKKDAGKEMYDRISSGAGIGLSFGSSPEQAHVRLGKPAVTTERGKIVEDHYLPLAATYAPPKMPDPEQVQLTLTYYDKKLVRVFNRYHPENPSGPTPPVVAEPVPGIKLGMKRSQVESILGKPNYGQMNDGWKFVGEDGSAVVIQPIYTEVPALKEWLSSALSIEFVESGATTTGKGEFYDKKKQRNDALHNR